MINYKRTEYSRGYHVEIRRDGGKEVIASWFAHASPSGLAGLIRAIDLATNEAKVARALGLGRKRPKKKG